MSSSVAPSSSVTVRRNASTVACVTAGAVNVAVAVFAPLSDTVGPLLWAHA